MNEKLVLALAALLSAGTLAIVAIAGVRVTRRHEAQPAAAADAPGRPAPQEEATSPDDNPAAITPVRQEPDREEAAKGEHPASSTSTLSRASQGRGRSDEPTSPALFSDDELPPPGPPAPATRTPAPVERARSTRRQPHERIVIPERISEWGT